MFTTNFVIASGANPGGGQAFVAAPIPPQVTGLTLYRQWLELQLVPTNTWGVVVSNARRLVVQ